MMYSLDEVGLVPATISNIKHRKDVNPFVLSPFGKEKLPIFVAPMTCILNATNINKFSNSRVEPILPVLNGDLGLRIQLPEGNNWNGWTALTLGEFIYYFCDDIADKNKKYYILIDVANGHMKSLFDSVKIAKQKYGDNLTVMIGNIADPLTYIWCCETGVDYVRVGIGGGSGCTTSVQTGIHTSIPYILEGIKESKTNIEGFQTKVVADGGINTIAKAIKCLALGADYVMMGKVFAHCEEGTTNEIRYMATKPEIRDTTGDKIIYIPHNLYYGQSSARGQIDRFGEVTSNPEGDIKWVQVDYTLSKFTNKFEAALRSAMSYCNAATLKDFIGRVNYEYMSSTEFNAFNK